MHLEPFTSPIDVRAVEREVVLLGPDGFSGSMTPDAAEESGRRLISAAAEAREQVISSPDIDIEPGDV